MYLKFDCKLNQSSIVINHGRFFSEVFLEDSKSLEAETKSLEAEDMSQEVLDHKTFFEDNQPMLYLCKDNI